MLWLACKKCKFQSKKLKVLVQLVTSPVGHVLSVCDTGSWSFHCQEEEVVAALWSQPHAVPSTLGTKWPRAFARATGFISWLGMGEPDMSHNTRPSGALSTVQHFKALTWVKGSRYWTRRAKRQTGEIMKSYTFFVLSDMGLWWELWVFNCMFGCQEKWNLTPDASLENPLCLMRQLLMFFKDIYGFSSTILCKF